MHTTFSVDDLHLLTSPKDSTLQNGVRMTGKTRILLKGTPQASCTGHIMVDLVLITEDSRQQHRIRFEPYNMAQQDAIDTCVSLRDLLGRTDVTPKEQLIRVLTRELSLVSRLHISLDQPGGSNLQFALRFGEHYANTRFAPSRLMRPFFTLNRSDTSLT